MTTTITPIGLSVREVQLRDAKAALSSVVEHAIRGEPSVIIRRGRPVAVVVGYDEWQRLARIPSFGRLLTALPVEDEGLVERDRSPLPDLDV